MSAAPPTRHLLPGGRQAADESWGWRGPGGDDHSDPAMTCHVTAGVVVLCAVLAVSGMSCHTAFFCELGSNGICAHVPVDF